MTTWMMAWTTARRSLGLLLLSTALVPCGCTGGRPPASSATLPAHNFRDPAYYVAPPAPAWTPTVAQAQRDVNASPQSGKAHYRLGLAYYKQHDYPRAIVALERARRLAPRQPAPCRWLGEAYTAVGQPARALPVLEQLVRMPLPNPQTHGDAWVNLGNCHWDLYQGAEAARAWRESLRYDPHQPSALLVHWADARALRHDGQAARGTRLRHC